ncbi:MAG: ASKHA domain-containing protein [Nitrospinota bacterium]|nr:ASKHA domain-containing protein [Nitrospinota bacterium]
MNSTERIQAVIGFGRVDRPPVAPELIAVTATICGAAVGDYVKDGAVIAQCQMEAARITGSDALFAAADLCVEAEALGCEAHFPRNNYPHIKSPIVHSYSDLKQLRLPDPTSDGRMPQILKAVRLLADDSDGRLVLGNAVGPITMASRIMDIEKMLYMIVDQPDKFREIIEFCEGVASRFVDAILEAGADGILIFDPSASPALLPPRIFREFELEPIRRILAGAKQKNPSVVTWYSVAGPVQTNTAIISAVGADVTTVDYPVPLQTAMEYSGHTVINGNIRPALFLEGTPSQVYDEAMTLLDQTRLSERFILGSGCEIPINSPARNIMALRRAANDHASQITQINEPAAGKVRATFHPHNRAIYVETGQTILEAAAMGGAPITTYCDLTGVCAECVVTVCNGKVSALDMIEEAQLGSLGEGGGRLACLAKIQGDVEIYVPFSSRRIPDKACAPAQLFDESTCADSHSSDFDPVFPPMREKARISAADHGSRLLHQDNLGAGAPCGGNLPCHGAMSRSSFAVAVDMSGENAVAYVHDIGSAEFRHAGSFLGPVAAVGLNSAEIDTRRALDPPISRKLREESTRLFNSIVNWLYESHSIMPERVRGLLVTGCPMADDTLRPPGESLPGEWAQITCGGIAEARMSDYPGLKVLMWPKPPHRFGGASRDAAFILATMPSPAAEPALFIHLGSSGSITAHYQGRYYTHRFPFGNLLERPIPGVSRGFFNFLIHEAQVDGRGVTSFKTFNGSAPLGLLGTAMVGAAAGMKRHGIIDDKGFVQGKWAPVVENRFVVVPKQKTAGYSPITIGWEDIDKLMIGTGACSRAVSDVLDAVHLSPEQVERVFVSGPFGVVADPADLIELGFIPDSWKGKIQFVKNAAGLGARKALFSSRARKRAVVIASSMAPLSQAPGARYGESK